MDIVSRIKAFISSKGLAVSQFADSCEIPRPTVSQLLNGRNKKVSDEIISKVHRAYPELSISWLLFEEGSMLLDDFASIEGENAGKNLKFTSDNQGDFKNQNVEEANSSYLFDFNELNSSESVDLSSMDTHNSSSMRNLRKIINDSQDTQNLSNGSIRSKSIVNILVFYSDNSFESFRPTEK